MQLQTVRKDTTIYNRLDIDKSIRKLRDKKSKGFFNKHMSKNKVSTAV